MTSKSSSLKYFVVTSLAITTLVLSEPLYTFAQDRILTIDYKQIVNSNSLTHSGSTTDQITKEIDRLNSSQIDPLIIAKKKAEVAKWTKEFQTRKQKAEATRQRLNLMIFGGTITASEAKQKYNEWLQYAAEANFQLQDAKEILSIYQQQSLNRNQALQNLQSQIEPFFEPYSYLLEDTLESIDPGQPKNLIDLGDLFPEGEKQPAWADLVRSRHYLVLSDGNGYARIFIPGNNAQSAYQQEYKVLRHVINWLWSSTETEWNVDIYAYQNNLATQKLILNTTPYKTKVTALLKRPAGAVPIDLEAIKQFLDQKNVLEGAYINKEGTLVLVGSKTNAPSTLEGQPIELSDLAVAYRAVYYAGHGDAYISLDPSPYVEQVNVNFGGRLADTRVGWVVLRSDMRFKTISDSFDPVTGEDLAEKIRKVLPDFKTQEERAFINPQSDITKVEYTRFWFSPDNRKLFISTSLDKKTMKISSPRFTGNAVKEDPVLGNTVVNELATPIWTRETLAHLNKNYEAFSGQFPELQELDNVGRLLALFTWLKQQNTKLDLDALLNVELPTCSTPRRKPQILIGYAGDNKLTSKNFSEITENLINRRSQGQDTLDNSSFHFPKTLKELGNKVSLSDYFVIAGGIDLSLTKSIAKPKALKPAEIASYRNLEKSVSGEIAISPTKTLVRARVKPTIQISEYPAPKSIAHKISPSKPDPVFNERATSRDIAGTGKKVVEVKDQNNKISWLGRETKNSLSNDNSRRVFYDGNEIPVVFNRYEKGVNQSYKLSPKGNTLTAVKAEIPNKDDFGNVINKSLKNGEATSETWKKLPEGTDVLAFEKVPGNQTIILRKKDGFYELTRYDDQGNLLETLKNDQAIAKMDRISRELVATESTDNMPFVHGSAEGDKFVMAVGSKKQTVPIVEVEELMNNPLRSKHSPLDDLFNVADGTDKTFVIYRDAMTRRPSRYGGSIREGGVTDPMQMLSLLKQRYPKIRVIVDDEMQDAKKNFASIKPISNPKEVGLMIPDDSFEIKDFGLIRRIKSNLSQSGIILINSPAEIRSIPNILVIAGHNDNSLREYLTNLGEQGLLRDKVVLLNTCYDSGNPNLIHELIAKYGPKGVFLHTEKISDVALDPVLRNLGKILQQTSANGMGVHPADLFEKAIVKTLEDPSLRPAQIREIKKLFKSALQVSYYRAEANPVAVE